MVPPRSTIYDLRSSFHSWLVAKNYSDSTVRNYLVDINKYMGFCQSQIKPPVAPLDKGGPVIGNSHEISSSPLFKGEGGFVFSESLLSSYISSISTDLNAKRTLASLSLFCQFAVDQNIISTNPIKKILHHSVGTGFKPVPTLDIILSSFKTYLFKHHKTAHTVTNYLADIKQYLSFCEDQKLKSPIPNTK